MKFSIPFYLEKNNILKKIDDLSYAKYVSHTPQSKNQVEIMSNVLIYVTKGYKVLHMSFGDYRIEAGNVLFLKSGTYVMSEVLDESYEAFLFFYSDALLIDFIDKYNIAVERKLEHDDVCILKHIEEFENVILSFAPYFEDKKENAQILKVKFEELFLKILSSKDSATFQRYLSQIYNEDIDFKNNIENSYKQFGSVREMSQYFKMNEKVFRSKFQKIFGQTPKQWLSRKKLTKAKLLLEKSEKNVTEVATEVGFSDLSWFSQRFKKEFGISSSSTVEKSSLSKEA